MVFLDLFDPPDDRDDDGEGESVEEHKSVIMHLLSQVRLGMDLTKVNLLTVHGEERGSKLWILSKSVECQSNNLHVYLFCELVRLKAL